MIVFNQIEIENPNALFDSYRITDKDRNFYNSLFDVGKGQEAIDAFIDKYMTDPIELYNAEMQRYLFYAQSGEMAQENRSRMERSISALSFSLGALLTQNFQEFTVDVYGPVIFADANITKLKVQRMILQETMQQYETSIIGAMSRTQAEVLNAVRTMQREMITFNQYISNRRFVGARLDQEVTLFRSQLKIKYPQYYKSMENGKFFRNRRGAYYKLEDYNEMATRTTILNVDRTSVEVQSRIRGDKVVEYYLRDNRPLKTGEQRVICKTILRNKILGKSLLALDNETANILGIMTIETAKGTPDYAMGPNCRHSFKRVSRRFKSRIDALIRQGRAA